MLAPRIARLDFWRTAKKGAKMGVWGYMETGVACSLVGSRVRSSSMPAEGRCFSRKGYCGYVDGTMEKGWRVRAGVKLPFSSGRYIFSV